MDLPKPPSCLLLTDTDNVTHSLNDDYQVPSSTSFYKPTELFEALPSNCHAQWWSDEMSFSSPAEVEICLGNPDWVLRLSPEHPLNFHTIWLWLFNPTWQQYLKVSGHVSELSLCYKERHHWRGERETLSSVCECAWQSEETSINIQFWMDYLDISLDSNTDLETKHS